MDLADPGLGLLGFGAALLLARLILPIHARRQRADRGGVVVGRDNRGVINTGVINTGSIGSPPAPRWERWLAIAGSLASLAGLAVYFLG